MSDFRAVQPGLIGAQDIATTSTTKKHELGTVVKAKDVASTAYGEGEFIYLQGIGSTAVGSWITIIDNSVTALAVADAVGQVAVAMSANVASQYGWYQISGQAAGKVLTGFVSAGSDAFLTSTAGSLDDADVAGDFTLGAVPVSDIDTPSTGLAEFQLSRPSVSNGLDN
jgi:hypothetical protein